MSAWLPTLLLIAVVVLLALWGFNSLLFTSGRVRVPAETATPPADETVAPDAAEGQPGGASLAAPLETPPPGAPGGGAGSDEAGADEVYISIVTEPAGAEVTIDGFPMPGLTPLRNIPVTPRSSRVVHAELDGYVPYESSFDMTFDRNLSIALTPAATAPPTAEGGVVAAGAPVAPTDAATPPPAEGAAGGPITLTVTDTTWLEVFQSTARNQGERLVYTNAQAGASYTFTPPVYIYVGNAGGARLAIDGQDQGVMGSPGQIVGRAVTP